MALRRLSHDTGRAMSQENVEIVRAFLAAFSDRGLDALAEFVDPDVINWRAVEGAVDDAGEMQGLDAVRAYVADWLDTFENLAVEPDELIDAGSDHVLAVLRLRGRAKASGIETELQYAVVYTLRDGKMVRGREYESRDGALEAVGLRE